MGVDLNLVPFVDFLSCLLAFLLMTAVLVDVDALDVNQGGGSGEAGTPPLTLHLSAGGVWIGRSVTEGVLVPRVAGEIDWPAVQAHITADREHFPEEVALVINTDDGLPYGEMATALDLGFANRYEHPALAGGPASTLDR